MQAHINPLKALRRVSWRMARTRIVSVVSGKGGVGKTTTSLSLASYWALTGHETYLVDADPQDAGSAQWWLGRSSGHKNLTIGKHTDLDTLSRLREVSGFSYVVVDTPPRPDSEQLTAICHASDLVVVMAGVGPLPLSAAVQTVSSLVRPTGVPHVCLVSMIDARRHNEAVEARDQLREAGIPALEVLARHYVVLERCASEGTLPAAVRGDNAGQVLDDIQAMSDEVADLLARPRRRSQLDT